MFVLDIFAQLTTAAIAFAVAVGLSLFVKRYFSRYVRRFVIRKKAGSEGIYRLLQKIIIVIIFIVALYVSLYSVFPQAGSALASTLVAAGFLSVVIGLAAQKTLENLFAGFSIAISKPFKLGDAVVIRGEYGGIEDITLRQTIMRTWDNRRLVIPNSVLDNDVVINYSMKDPKKLYNITVGVTYDTDVEKVAKIMVDEARRHKDVLKELDPIFQVLDFSEGAITLRLLFMSKDQPTAFNAAVDIRRSIKRRFDKAHIRFSAPARYVVK